MADAWPTAPDESAYWQVRTSTVETLLISGALDTVTPPQAATKELLPYLPNATRWVLPNVGHIASFFDEQPEAGSHLINTFFASGAVDRSLYQAQKVDFTPGTAGGATAKTALGLMLAMTALTVLSLLWMAFRVRSRGRLGRITSVLVRSIGALVLGVGGWILGLLVVLATMPGVSLDNQLLADPWASPLPWPRSTATGRPGRREPGSARRRPAP